MADFETERKEKKRGNLVKSDLDEIVTRKKFKR